jgi:hypothetical protein
MRSSHVVLDQVDITFDDPRAVAHAGLLLPATLAERLGIEQATDELVDLGDRTGAAHPGRKLLTLVHAMVAGGDCIDDVELLRCGSTASILGHRVMAASTVGTWLRGFTFGHVRQLDKMTGEVLARAWGAGAGPGDGPLAVDVDSTICEVCGYHKQAPATATPDGWATIRCWPPGPTAARCCMPGCARTRPTPPAASCGSLRAGGPTAPRRRQRRAHLAGRLGVLVGQAHRSAPRPPGPLLDHGSPDQTVRAAIAAIPEAAWVPIAYQRDGLAQVAETPYQATG